MKASELSSEVRELINACVPNLDALELLVFLTRNPEVTWAVEQLVDAVPQLTALEVRQYLTLFSERRLLTSSAGAFGFEPGTPALASAVSALRRAYDERPVTLIRTVYAISDERKIQSFADAFRLKRDS